MQAKGEGIEETDPPEYHLAALNRQIREAMNFTLRAHGLKLVEWRLLSCLRERGALTINDLSVLAVVDRTVTSRLIDKLVERKLVRKAVMENDRRFAQAKLTSKGEARLSDCDQDVAALRGQLFAGMDQADITQMLDLLKRMQSNLTDLHRPGGLRTGRGG
ncbi:MAG: MarR family transcriptional regulator [Pelagimonas sp.]|jgi:DNA-binding MarR family transcriptional regulator|nr:MarR family transcriptional regulator [Pelagimonas sp.]